MSKWIRLVLGLAVIAAIVGLLHLGSGRLIEENRANGLDADAIFYTEVGDLGDFLDDEGGRYGRAAVAKALDSTHRDSRSGLRGP